MRSVVDACVVGGQPAPAFERILNRILTRRTSVGAEFRSADYKCKLAREARVTYDTIDRYFRGEFTNHFTRKRIRAAIRRLECK